MKLKWGIIGAGGIADRRSIPAMLLDADNEIVAVMDKNPETAKAMGEKYHVERWFSDEEEMLKSVSFDAVYIATPVFCHYEQAMLCLKYGKHVIMEKPITLNAEEAEKLINAFKAAGKQLTVAYMMGYHNLHILAREMIREGKIGDVNLVRMQFADWYPDIPGAWRQVRKLSGGGCIMDLAVHCMELFHSITGDEIKECKAYFATQTFRYEVEDNSVIMFRSEKGILGHIDASFNIPNACAPAKVEIYGTSGSICLEGTIGQTETGTLRYIYCPQTGADAGKVSEPQIFTGENGNFYTKQFAAFRALIESGTPCYANAEQALKIQKLCDGIYSEVL